MFQRILVSLDGSLRDEHALAMATHLAHATHGSLVLTRIVSTATDFWPALTAQTPLIGMVVQAHLYEAKAYLAKVALRPIFSDIPIETIVRFGPVVPTLLSTIRVHKADTLILCRHKSIDPLYIMQESITARLISRIPVPTLVLNEADRSNIGFHPARNHSYAALVVLANATSTRTEKNTLQTVAHLLTMLSSPKQGRLHLTTVINPESSSQREHYGEHMENAIQQAKRDEQKMIEQVQETWMRTQHSELCVEMTSSVVVANDIAKVVAEMATQRDDEGEVDPSRNNPRSYLYDFIILSGDTYKESTPFSQNDMFGHTLECIQRPLVIIPAQESATRHKHEPGRQKQEVVAL